MLIIANDLSISPTLIALMMGAVRSSETSDPTTAIHLQISEEYILHIHRRENLKSYTASTGWCL
jgi:hypothetical protein